MRKQTLSFEEREALKDKARKKLQALINLGFEVKSINGIKEDKANQIATDLENDDSFILTMPAGMCIVFKVSNMALKLLKPYIKDLLEKLCYNKPNKETMFLWEDKNEIRDFGTHQESKRRVFGV